MKGKILISILLSALLFASCSSSDQARKEAEEQFGPIKTLLVLPYVSKAGPSLSDINPRAKDYIFRDRGELLRNLGEKGYNVIDFNDVSDKLNNLGSINTLYDSDEAMAAFRQLDVDAVISMDIANYNPRIKSSKERKRSQTARFPFNYRFSIKMKHTGTLGVIFSTYFFRSYENNGIARTQNGGYASAIVENFTNKGF